MWIYNVLDKEVQIEEMSFLKVLVYKNNAENTYREC